MPDVTEKSKELVKVDKTNLPDVYDLILETSWSEGARELIKAKHSPADDSLIQLAYHCYAAGLGDASTYVMLDMAVKKWKVDADLEAIAEVGKALAKEATQTKLINFMDLLEADFEVEWIIPDLLTESGIICFSGEPGVGKTRAMLQMCMALALGEDFLGFKVNAPPRRILFLSLEMIGKEIKSFAAKMAKGLNPAQQKLLRENFIFYPHGEQLYLNVNDHREEYWRIINEAKPDGVIIDSWSMSVLGNLSDDVAVRDSMAFINAVRKFKGCFFGIIAHNKKKQEGNEKPTTMDDIFGSRYFTAGLSNAVVFWKHRGGGEGVVEMHFVKSRFSELPPGPTVVRTAENLKFELTGRRVADSPITKILGNNGSMKERRQVAERKATVGALLGGNFRQYIPKEEMPKFDPKLIDGGSEMGGYPGVDI